MTRQHRRARHLTFGLFTKDGKQKKNKAPEKAFVSTDVYTIQLPNGGRDLVIEDTLAEIESKFAQVVERTVAKEKPLSGEDRGVLCTFAAAMTSRVDPQARSFQGPLREVYEKVQRIEQQHKLDPSTSLEIGALLDNVRPFLVASSLPIIALLYYRMSMAILVSPGEEMFITSDSPTVWYNPESYKWPPAYRSPGLAQGGIKVTLPLTPRYALLLSHK